MADESISLDINTPEPKKDTLSPYSDYLKNLNSSGDQSSYALGVASEAINQVADVAATVAQISQANRQLAESTRQFNVSQEAAQQKFDKTFYENIRQFNLNYALNEFATRKGLELQEVNDQWNRYITGQQVPGIQADNKAKQLSLEQSLEKDRKNKLFNSTFIKSFANVMGKQNRSKANAG